MKSFVIIRSFQYAAVTVAAAALLNIGILAQPKTDNSKAESTSFKRLENFMSSAEQSVKYTAPDADFEAVHAMKNMDRLALSIEKDLQYRAPDASTEEALQDLDILADNTMKEIKYSVPADNEQPASEVKKMQRTVHARSLRPVQVEITYTPQDTWLINAGYYRTSRTPAWHKVKNAFKTKRVAKEYASEF